MIAVLAAVVWLAAATLLGLGIGRAIRIADERDRRQP